MKLYHDISNRNIENIKLKEELAEKDSIINQTINSGRILLEELKSTENFLQSMGKYLQFSYVDSLVIIVY